MRQPINPPKTWNSQQVLDYLNTLHDDLYPRVVAWAPAITGVEKNPPTDPYTPIDFTAGYVRQAGLIVISVVIQGPTISTSGQIPLPFLSQGDYVLNVQAGASLLPAIVYKSTSTLVLPDWNEAGNVIISGVIAV